jgi:glycosyltransferase involved in cell wall biosynthesis
MNIIVFEKYPSSQRGGQERSLLDVTRQLAQLGHRITLVHENDGDFLEQYRSFCDRVIRVKGFAISPYNWRSPFWFLQDLFRLLRGVKFEKNKSLIYVNQFYDLPLAAIWSQFIRIPLAAHLRLPAPQNLDIQRSWALRQVHQFISVSEANRQGWITSQLLRSPIEVVHNGVLPEQFSPRMEFVDLREACKLRLDTRVVSYVGRLDRRKGLETLITAFASLLPTYPNSQLLIVGKPLLDEASYLDELQGLVERLGIGEQVQFLGHLSHARDVFQVSDVMVVPSQWAEPCARVIIESMASGIPVLASRVGGNVELLGDRFAEHLFDARNSDSLASVLVKWLNWRSQNPIFGDELRQYAMQNFHLADKITAIEQILLKTIEGSNSRISKPPIHTSTFLNQSVSNE